MNKKKMKLLSKLAINPLRIAFDHIKDREIYEDRVRMAHANQIKNLSNYVLYNFDDTPEDLWERLNININLNIELGLTIYSFPMKYIPLNAKDRSFINEPDWNWQYIRGVQRILNVLKGTVMTTQDFFFRAFGESADEFVKILYMPEKLLMNRGSKPGQDEKDWCQKYEKLTKNERQDLLRILCENKKVPHLLRAYTATKNGKLKKILSYYIDEELLNSKEIPLFKDLN
jgi:hypothetical protein